MDLIREMAMVIEQDRPKSFNLLIPKGSKLKRLYSLAAQEEFRGDAHAAKAIYNDIEKGMEQIQKSMNK